MSTFDIADAPQIHAGWMYSMVALGIIGTCIIFCILCFAIYKTYYLSRDNKRVNKLIITLNFTIWICNFLACIGWAFFRTNLFHQPLYPHKCAFIYISNYFCFMVAKYCIHVLLLYRLYFAFKGTLLEVNKRLMTCLIAVISVTFIIFTALWMEICIENVTVGVSTHSDSFQICTLYNSESNDDYTVYDQIWPILFGSQDFIVGVITMTMFVKKISDLATLPQGRRDQDAESLIRKLSILGSFAIISTFIFYTFAIPFWPNFTFLLPFDAMLNSLCTLLLLEYASRAYGMTCCCLDVVLKKVLHHMDEAEVSLVEIVRQETVNGSYKMEKVVVEQPVPAMVDACSAQSVSSGTDTTENTGYVPKLQTINSRTQMLGNALNGETLTVKNRVTMKDVVNSKRSKVRASSKHVQTISSDDASVYARPLPLAESKHTQSAFF